MRALTYLIYIIFWESLVLGGSIYLYGWQGWSGWWVVLGLFLSMSAYGPSKQTDLWACHRMSEDDLFMLRDNKFAIGEVYRKLKNDIEAMKEQNKKEVLDSIMARAKKQWEKIETIEKSLSFYSNIVNPETKKSYRKVTERY